MPARLLVAAQPIKSYQRGDIVSQAIGDSYGALEVLPQWGRLIVSDAEPRQVARYLRPWKMDYEHEMVRVDAAGWRMRITPDPELVSVAGVGATLPATLEAHVTTSPTWQGTTVFQSGSDFLTIDVPRNIPYWTARGVTSQQARRLLELELESVIAPTLAERRYTLMESVVVAIEAAPGGELTQTIAQLLTGLTDKRQDT